MKSIKLLLVAGWLLLLAACSSNPVQTDQKVKRNLTAAGYNVQLGVAYLRDGYTQRAKGKLLLALQQAPEWAPAYDAMAYFYEMTGNKAEAEKFYTRALELDPNSGAAHNNYGTFLCRNKQYQEAEKHFLLAVKDQNYLSTGEAYENAGLCAMEIPDNKKAQSYFNLALQQEPKRSTSLLELATLKYKEGNYSHAKAYLSKYMEIAAANPDPQAIWLGTRIAQKQKDKLSLAHYQKLLNEKFADAKLSDADDGQDENK